MIIFKCVRWKNLLSYGNTFTEINLNDQQSTMIAGANGSGKCLDKKTKIDIDIKDASVKKAFEEFMKNRK